MEIAFEITPPAEVAARLNRLFPFDVATEQFATMVYGILDSATGRVPLRLRRAPRPGSSARRRRSGDSGEPRIPDRPGRRRLRGAVGPPGGGRPTVPLLRWRPRGDGPCRQAVRRQPGFSRRSPNGGPNRYKRVSLRSWKKSRVGMDPRDLKTISPSWRSSCRPGWRPLQKSDCAKLNADEHTPPPKKAICSIPK